MAGICCANQGLPRGLLIAGHNHYDLEIASSTPARQNGLSGRNDLPARNGMLFIHSLPGKQCYWMKDMRFDIDIIWLSGYKTITHIERGVSPDTYPRRFCSEPAQYVLELRSGQADAAGLHTGQKLAI